MLMYAVCSTAKRHQSQQREQQLHHRRPLLSYLALAGRLSGFTFLHAELGVVLRQVRLGRRRRLTIRSPMLSERVGRARVAIALGLNGLAPASGETIRVLSLCLQNRVENLVEDLH